MSEEVNLNVGIEQQYKQKAKVKANLMTISLKEYIQHLIKEDTKDLILDKDQTHLSDYGKK